MPIPTFGEMLIADDIISEEQLERALALQQSGRDQKNLLGVILIRLGFITMDTLVKYLEIQTRMVIDEYPEKRVPPIGELLTRNGEITEEQLQDALRAQRTRGNTPLGIILVQLNYIDGDILIHYLIKQTALAVQEG